MSATSPAAISASRPLPVIVDSNSLITSVTVRQVIEPSGGTDEQVILVNIPVVLPSEAKSTLAALKRIREQAKGSPPSVYVVPSFWLTLDDALLQLQENLLSIIVHVPHLLILPSYPAASHTLAARLRQASLTCSALLEGILANQNETTVEPSSSQTLLQAVERASSTIVSQIERLIESTAGGTSWQDAKQGYANVLASAGHLVDALESFLNFKNGTIPQPPEKDPSARLSNSSYLSPPDSPRNSVSQEDQFDEDADLTKNKDASDAPAKSKSFGAKFIRRISHLTKGSHSSQGDDAEEGRSSPSFHTSYVYPSTDDVMLGPAADVPQPFRTSTLIDTLQRRHRSVETPRRQTNAAYGPGFEGSVLSSVDVPRSRSFDHGLGSVLTPLVERSTTGTRERSMSRSDPPKLPEISLGWLDTTDLLGDTFAVLKTNENLEIDPPPLPPKDSQAGQPPEPGFSVPSIKPSNSKVPSSQPVRSRHTRHGSGSSMSSARRLRSDTWVTRLPSDPEQPYKRKEGDRWSRMMENLALTDLKDWEGAVAEESDPLGGEANATEQLLSRSESQTETRADGLLDNAFQTMKTLRYRAVQRIPTFDSTGTQIGVLDQGRFSSAPVTDEEVDKGTQEFILVRGNRLLLCEEGSDVLVMDMVNGKLEIAAGTLEKLVARLAEENSQDLEFVDMFLENHPFYIPSRDLLVNLIARFYFEAPPGATELEIDYCATWRRPIRVKVLSVLSRWVRLRFEDFEEDVSLRETLEDFLSAVESEEGFIGEVRRIRRVATAQAMSLSTRLNQAPRGIIMLANNQLPSLSASPFPTSLQQMLPETSPLLNFEAAQLAKYLTMADVRAFRSITIADYVAKLHLGRDVADGKGEDRGRRIDWFAKRSDMIRNWICLELCTLAPKKLRRKLLEKLITVALYCRSHRNFHTPLFILLALQSPAVQRLKHTWDAIPKDLMDKLKTLEKLLDVSGNMRELRKAIDENGVVGDGPDGTGVVPFFPVVMKDVTFIVEGNPQYVERILVGSADMDPSNQIAPMKAAPEHNGIETPAGNPSRGDDEDIPDQAPLINFDKYRTLCQVLAKYMKYVESYTWEAPLVAPSITAMVYGSPPLTPSVPPPVSALSDAVYMSSAPSTIQLPAGAISSNPTSVNAPAVISPPSYSSATLSSLVPIQPHQHQQLSPTLISPTAMSPLSATATSPQSSLTALVNSGSHPPPLPHPLAPSVLDAPFPALPVLPVQASMHSQPAAATPAVDPDMDRIAQIIEPRLLAAADDVHRYGEGWWMKKASEFALRCSGEDHD
ncbi:ras guanine nucleotide exchange factor domain-containing protein [Fimicolochytrium jonesii]|uniref:ras guanine nucleotide exchange factor domain-containing protein n=1 Tax=Fimicolochytrium jonesii TaxID=1396493 RepID=UPI0022FDD9AB|nr:ras guanine nucleotide exchange factor domain-containing protein [Fimicolochytrium jonesii]KAI8820508.1 ras guanine nucleotide exchange factor domain-containing protein [Fimicolochytrium jonesii]